MLTNDHLRNASPDAALKFIELFADKITDVQIDKAFDAYLTEFKNLAKAKGIQEKELINLSNRGRSAELQQAVRNSLNNLLSGVRESVESSKTEFTNLQQSQKFIASLISKGAVGVSVAMSSVKGYEAYQDGDASEMGSVVIGAALSAFGAAIGAAFGVLLAGAFTGAAGAAAAILLPVAGAFFGSAFVGGMINDLLQENFPEIYDAIGATVFHLVDSFISGWEMQLNIFDRFLGLFDTDGIRFEVYADFASALNFVMRRDPLALDLDGDGIETVSANTGIVFDFNGDGLKTGTGWVKSDDGLLVRDLNKDGFINNGGELFGIDTIKSNGEKATDGFDALRDLDSNGDGVFDFEDAEFSNVLIWQDLNQDGISQKNELKTLAEHNIIAINLNSDLSSQNTNGNIISAIGGFVRADNSSGEVNGEHGQAANLDLASNPFFRDFTDSIALDSQVSALPSMQGSGAVRDLQEASMLNSELKEILASYAASQTRQEQMALLDEMLVEWSKSSGFRTFDQRISEMNTDTARFVFSYSWEKPEGDTAFSSSSSNNNNTGSVVAGEETKEVTAIQIEQKELFEKIKILEIFNSQSFFNFSATERTDSNGNKAIDAVFSVGATDGRRRFSGAVAGQVGKYYVTEEHLRLNSTQVQLINSSYESLRKSIYQGLLTQTRLQPYLSKVELVLTNYGFALNYDGSNKLLAQVHQADPIKASVDLFDLIKVAKGPLHEWAATLSDWVEGFDELNKTAFLKQLGGTGSIISGDDSSESFIGGSDSDFVFGNAGNDTLRGNNGDDFLSGGAGNDVL